MKSKIAGVALAAVMACGLGGVSRAEAALVITIEESGDAVVVAGSGSLDLSGLTQLAGHGHGSGPFADINSSQAIVLTVPGLNNGQDYTNNLYDGVIGPTSFGTGIGITAKNVSGDYFALFGYDGHLGVLPTFSGGPISFADTLYASSIFDLGLIPNTSFVYNLGSSPTADTITINVGPSSMLVH